MTRFRSAPDAGVALKRSACHLNRRAIMNENANIVTSFRHVVARPSPMGRRRRVGPVSLREQDLDTVNQLLLSLGWAQGPLTLDQWASAARALSAGPEQASLAPYIRVQLDRGLLLTRMVADCGWEPANDVSAAARATVAYIEGDDSLIPNWLPGVGRLDDAVIIETAWPRLVAEVIDFQDFCRVRRIEAQLRDAEPGSFAFDRQDWLAASRAETKLREQRRVLRQRFQRSAPLSLFRVC